MLKKIFFTCIILALFISLSTNAFAQENLVVNADFEQPKSEVIPGWETSISSQFADSVEFAIEESGGRNGSACISIINATLNDSRLTQELSVESNSYYRLSCWIKTENINMEHKGANISVLGINETSPDVTGTHEDWQYVEFYGRTGEAQNSFVLTLGIGGYGSENTGRAWFDDVVVEEVESVPEGKKIINLSGETTETATSNTKDPSGRSPATAKPYRTSMLTYSAVFAAACILFYLIFRKRGLQISTGKYKALLVLMFFTAFVLRIFIAPLIEGWPNDIYAMKYWAVKVAENLPEFYQLNWCDYPPVYMYVLFIVGKIVSIPWLSEYFTVIVKFPPMLADLVTAYLLFRLARKHLKPEYALLAAGVYLFHPAILLDSAIWGQVDSFFTMIVVAAFIALFDGKLGRSTILFTISVLMKPQGIFFLPVLLFALIRRKNWREFSRCALYAIITAIVAILPFSFTQEPLWIFKLYINTAAEYVQASLNAFNLFGLLGANFKDASQTMFIFSYNVWGLIFDVLILAFVAYLFFRKKAAYAPMMCALLLNVGAFILSTKMHERYMYPAIAIALMALILIKDRRLLAIFAGLSLTIFMNIHTLFHRMLVYGLPACHFPADDLVLLIFSAVNLLILVYLAVVSASITSGRIKPLNIALNPSAAVDPKNTTER